ncbi:MAG: hypothetical protein EH225_12275 [Calditrichaeota bacterium]|nr:hypothetical protein [Calditrichota bacterium]RQV99006.1 MAG: hypothetical protein EH225_12275 [Calditrichota bacterium]
MDNPIPRDYASMDDPTSLRSRYRGPSAVMVPSTRDHSMDRKTDHKTHNIPHCRKNDSSE